MKKHLVSLLLICTISSTWAFTPAELQVRNPASGTVVLCGDSTYEFGEINLGEHRMREYLLRNIGDDPLFLNDLYLTGTSEYELTLGFEFADQPFEIPGQQQVSIYVHYAPNSPGEHTTELVIRSSDLLHDPCLISFEGVGYEPLPAMLRIRRDDASFSQDCSAGLTSDFPDLVVGESFTRTYHMENVGDEPLHFFNINVSDSPDFSISYNFPFTGPSVIILPGESRSYDVTFAPDSPGEKDAYYTIETSISRKGGPSCTIKVRGLGINNYYPYMVIFSAEGPLINCNDTYYIDLHETTPGPGAYSFLLRFNNYGMSDLVFSGFIAIDGDPASEIPFGPYSIASLASTGLLTTVMLPGNQITRLVYRMETNNPYQRHCTFYVEINQKPDKLPLPADDKAKASIIEVALKKQQQDLFSGTAELTYQVPENAATAQARLYPSISRSKITLQLPDAVPQQYYIFNMNSQVVFSGHTGGTQQEIIPLQQLNTGMYLLRLEGSQSVLRFIKTN